MAEPLFPATGADRSRSGSEQGRIALGGNLGNGAGARARAGDIVLVGIAKPGRRGRQARIVRVIGRPEVTRDVIEGLMLDRGLARGFHPEVEREAGQARDRGAERRREQGRRDLRGLPTFTVDPVTARDFDDAVSAEAIERGGVRVWVHIADVSAHVPEGSLVDREARRRANSVYVPGAVEPMLPEALSNDACSLVPGRDRLAVTVELELNGARIGRTAFYRSVIRSDARLSYERVDRIFAGRESARSRRHASSMAGSCSTPMSPSLPSTIKAGSVGCHGSIRPSPTA
jgi:ribonuclease R